jgi:tetratricopeptide (TPR) repeat protein
MKRRKGWGHKAEYFLLAALAFGGIFQAGTAVREQFSTPQTATMQSQSRSRPSTGQTSRYDLARHVIGGWLSAAREGAQRLIDGDFAGAVQAYRRAVGADSPHSDGPGSGNPDPYVWLGYGIALAKQEELEEAKLAFHQAQKGYQRAVIKDPRDPSALLGLATAEAMTGQWSAARLNFRTALREARRDKDQPRSQRVIRLGSLALDHLDGARQSGTPTSELDFLIEYLITPQQRSA